MRVIMERKNDQRGLTLVSWLLTKLDGNSYACLRWICRESELFKINWEQKDMPGWGESHKLFTDWAKYKDNGKSRKISSDPKKRFLDALRHSNHFEEIKDQHVLNLQSGNYKVFRFLSVKESQVKKQQKKRKSATDSQGSFEAMNSSQSTDNSDIQSPFSSESFSSLFEEIENLSSGMVDSCLPQPNSGQSYDNVLIQPPQSYDCSLSATSNSNPVALAQADLAVFDPFAATENDEIMEIVNSQQQFSVETTQQPALNLNVEPPVSADHQQALQLPEFKSTEEVMNNLGIHCNLLPLFQLTFEYEKQVIHQTVVDFSKGCLLVHDGSNRNHHLGHWPVVLFPDYTGLSETVKGALKNIVNGLALQSCAGYDLIGYRFGHGCIFYSNCDTENFDFVKMEKKNEVVLFSYLNYVEQVISYQSGRRQNRAPCQVMLTFGTKPSSIHSQRPVSVVIEPLEADQLKKAFDLPTEGSCSLQCSEDDSIQQLFETFDNIQDRNRAAHRDSLQPGSIR